MDIGLMVGQLEKLGYFLYFDDKNNCWEVWGEDEDAQILNFKNIDKDKVITQVYFTVFDH